MAVRITRNGAPVSAGSLSTPAGRLASRERAHTERTFALRIARTASAERIMVTRTDAGSPNARFGATAAERARHGAVNATSNAFDAGMTPPGGYITATQRDSFDAERPESVESWECCLGGESRPTSEGRTRVRYDDDGTMRDGWACQPCLSGPTV